jgi:hypothetical protein
MLHLFGHIQHSRDSNEAFQNEELDRRPVHSWLSQTCVWASGAHKFPHVLAKLIGMERTMGMTKALVKKTGHQGWNFKDHKQ